MERLVEGTQEFQETKQAIMAELDAKVEDFKGEISAEMKACERQVELLRAIEEADYATPTVLD